MTPDGTWATILDPPRPGRITAAHQVQYPDPIQFDAGDELQVGRRDDGFPHWIWCHARDGREGWVPDTVVDVDPGSSDRGFARHAYAARELAVSPGDEVLVIATFDGWHWVQAGDDIGWVPESFVEIHK